MDTPLTSPVIASPHQSDQSTTIREASLNRESIANSASTFDSLVSLDRGSDDVKPQRDLRQRISTAFGVKNTRTSKKPKMSYGDKLRPRINPLDKIPRGYSKVAAYQECDPNLVIFRKFGRLHTRLLLHRQDEIVCIERELDQLDKIDEKRNPERLLSRRCHDDIERRELLDDLEGKLKKYDELLLRYQKIYSIKQPTVRNQNSLYNAIRNGDGQLYASEEGWIQCSDDLAALADDEERGWLNEEVEKLLNRLSRNLTRRLFRTKDQNIKTGTDVINLLSITRLNRLVHILTGTIATILLLVPIYGLYQLENNGVEQLSMIFGFTLLFAAYCGFCTKATKHEVFAITAAYCAVLVVFLSNNTMPGYVVQSNRNVANNTNRVF